MGRRGRVEGERIGGEERRGGGEKRRGGEERRRRRGGEEEERGGEGRGEKGERRGEERRGEESVQEAFGCLRQRNHERTRGEVNFVYRIGRKTLPCESSPSDFEVKLPFITAISSILSSLPLPSPGLSSSCFSHLSLLFSR
eukprot:767464-Hanusia_phi.AAC.1